MATAPRAVQDRIRKLLAHARSTPVVVEAQTFIERAEETALLHGMSKSDFAELLALDASVSVGVTTVREPWRSQLAHAIAHANRCRAGWHKGEVFFTGARSDGERARRLYLAATAQVLARLHAWLIEREPRYHATIRDRFGAGIAGTLAARLATTTAPLPRGSTAERGEKPPYVTLVEDLAGSLSLHDAKTIVAAVIVAAEQAGAEVVSTLVLHEQKLLTGHVSTAAEVDADDADEQFTDSDAVHVEDRGAWLEAETIRLRYYVPSGSTVSLGEIVDPRDLLEID